KKMAKEKENFVKGAKEKHNIEEEKATEVFRIMEKFAEYGFNRSHSAAYSVVAYQTAYLKANYPAEYMASVLTHNMSNIDKVSFFMDECKRQNIQVLGPDINESGMYFEVNKDGKIRFGLGAIKGTGDAAVESIISERNENGPYKNFFNFSERVNLRTVNKKTFECLAYAGGFDSFTDLHRAQYFFIPQGDTGNLIEKAIRYGNAYRNEKDASQVSLFGASGNVEIPVPRVPDSETWGDIEKLKYEKDVVGFYISGHPLDQFRLELEHFCNCTLDKVLETKNKDVTIAGIVTKANVRQTKTGKSFVIFSIEDYSNTIEMALFGEDFLKLGHWIKPGEFLYIKGKMQQRYNTDLWEFKPGSIQLLADIRSKLLKNIQLKLDLAMVTPEVIEQMESILGESKGSCSIKMLLSDNSENINVEMFSRKYKVEPNNMFIDRLKALGGVGYKFIH
ncbi:MAG TPA: OB-fold nucleic acid binding domain-containing protein, partial [Cytophagaceae bacterium]|nr:OB-fold nucleic acid binding domain-containing protein [Cytophagaceae bacterium]